jgi:hypothetical protein
MAARRKIVASGAAALALVGGGTAIKYGDDVVRNFGDDAGRAVRSAPDAPPPRPPSRLPGTPPRIPPGRPSMRPATGQLDEVTQVKFRLTVFVVDVSNSGTATRAAARDAGKSAACEVLKIAVTQRKPPSASEWVAITVNAAAAAAIPGEYVRPFSPLWRSLEQLKKDVSKDISNELGYVDEEKAESVAEGLACAWT